MAAPPSSCPPKPSTRTPTRRIRLGAGIAAGLRHGIDLGLLDVADDHDRALARELERGGLAYALARR